MRTVGNLMAKLDAFDAEKTVFDSLEETKEYIADLNAEQMHKGLKANGQEITPFYHNITVEKKIAKGQPFDRVTLFDTGAFYRGIFAEIKKTGVYSFSTDEKAERLVKKYGKFIFGLSGPFKRVYRDEAFQPTFTKKRKEALGL